MSVGQKTGNAGFLLFLRKIWAALLYIITIAYLARVLSKEDFGLIAISSAFISLIEVFGPYSIQEYLVYKRDDISNKNIVNSAFWLNIALAILVMIGVFVIAPIIADYFGNEKIKGLSYVTGLCFVGHALSAIPLSILRKRLDFKPIIIIQFVTGTLSQFSQIILAAAGFGVYSLAIPAAIYPFVMGIYLIYVTKPQIRLSIDVKFWPRILSYTRYIMGNRLLERVGSYSDNFIIGKVLLLPTLGLYNIAYKLSNVLTDNILPILTDVTVPVFANNSGNRTKLRKQYAYMIRLSALFFIPIHLILIVFAGLLVSTIYGGKWVEAILPIQILSLLSLIRCVTSPANHIYYVLGLKRVPFYVMLAYIPLFITSLWLMSYYGLVMACVALAVSGIILALFNFLFIAKKIKLSAISFIKEIAHIVVPSVIMAIVSTVGIYYAHNYYIAYLLLLSYLPVVVILSYLMYKKDVLKDFIIISRLFPIIRKFRQ